MFRIKYAMGGGFGGTEFIDWEDCNVATYEEAEKEARYNAIEEYEGYEGCHGVMSWGDIVEENPEYTEEDIQDTYNAEIDSWIEYEVEKV